MHRNICEHANESLNFFKEFWIIENDWDSHKQNEQANSNCKISSCSKFKIHVSSQWYISRLSTVVVCSVSSVCDSLTAQVCIRAGADGNCDVTCVCVFCVCLERRRQRCWLRGARRTHEEPGTREPESTQRFVSRGVEEILITHLHFRRNWTIPILLPSWLLFWFFW